MSLPRVTELLVEAGLIDTQHFTDEARDRGTALHLACEYFDLSTLDVSSIDSHIMGRFNAYRRFLREVQPEILAIEESLVNKVAGYRGTLDRRLIIDGSEGVLDIKPPSMAPWHGLQLQFYADCFDRPMLRWNLHLSDSGTYKLVSQTKRRDRTVCRSILHIHHWKVSNGLS